MISTPGDRGSTTGHTVHEQPEYEGQPHDQEQLRDMQTDEQAGIVTQLRIGGRMQKAEDHVEKRNAEQNDSAPGSPIASHPPSRSFSVREPSRVHGDPLGRTDVAATRR